MPVREKIGIHVSAPLLVSIFSARDEAAASAISVSAGMALLGRGNNRNGQRLKGLKGFLLKH